MEKTMDLKIVIGLMTLWGILRILIIISILNGTAITNLYLLSLDIIIGVFLLISVYGLWTMKSWSVNLSMVSLIALIILNFYYAEYLAIIIVVIFAYIIYKNKGLYQ